MANGRTSSQSPKASGPPAGHGAPSSIPTNAAAAARTSADQPR